MTSASRDPAAEQQLPVRIVENSLSGRGRMKSVCFLTIVVASDCHTRNAGGIGPKVCFYPIICHAWGFEEEYVHAYLALAVCHKQRQLTDGGPGARAMRMDRQNQSSLAQGSVGVALGGPSRRGSDSSPWRSLIVEHPYEAENSASQPECPDDEYEYPGFSP